MNSKIYNKTTWIVVAILGMVTATFWVPNDVLAGSKAPKEMPVKENAEGAEAAESGAKKGRMPMSRGEHMKDPDHAGGTKIGSENAESGAKKGRMPMSRGEHMKDPDHVRGTIGGSESSESGVKKRKHHDDKE